jgi:hypothetical protein
MNWFVSKMQGFHSAIALPGLWWVKWNVWCGTQWEKLRRQK